MKIANKEILQSSLVKLPQIAWEDILVLYDNDYSDGSIEGMLKWKDKEYYFCWSGVMNESKDEMDRKFVLIDLTSDQLAKEKQMRELFTAKVGGFVYENGQRKENGTTKDDASQKEFYDQYDQVPRIEIKQDQLVGWFQDK